MDQFDRERFATVYRALAEILEHDRPAGSEHNHLSFALGDLTRRIFVGSGYLPPDELLEEVAEVLRTGQPQQQQHMVERLREHAKHLEELKE